MKFRGRKLLTEHKVRKLRSKLRRKQPLTPANEKQLSAVFTMALKYLHEVDRAAKFRGRYDPVYAGVAKSICRTFYTDDDELAGCFGISRMMFEEWWQVHPDFKNAVRTGRADFTRNRGSIALDRRWFYDMFGSVALRVIDEFDPTKASFGRAFTLLRFSKGRLCEGRMESPKAHELRDQLLGGVIYDVCAEFNPTDEELARCINRPMDEMKRLLQSSTWFAEAVNAGRRVAERNARWRRNRQRQSISR